MGELIGKICFGKSEGVKYGSSTHIENQVAEELKGTQAQKHLMKNNSETFKGTTYISKAVMRNMYFILEDIGEGAFGGVQKVHLKRDKEGKRIFAVKIMQKRGEPEQVKQMIREIELLKCMDHPYIIKIFEAYENKLTYSIIMEYCSGGELAQLILSKNGSFSESDINEFIFQAVQAVNYLHQKGIVHRDIKAENFLLLKPGGDQLKLIDFGLATTVPKLGTIITQPVGSPFYMAPETIEKKYTEKCDMWSIGILMYLLMIGDMPYDAKSDSDVLTLIKHKKPNMKAIEQSKYSKEAKDLIQKLLIRESEGRLGALESINHPWFAQKRERIKQKGKELLTIKMLEDLRCFGYKNLFQREMISLIVQFMEDDIEEIINLKAVFAYLDHDFCGQISPYELKDIYGNNGIEISDTEVNKIVDSMYFKEKAVITYLEFIAATLPQEVCLSKVRVRQLFDYIDINNSNDICKGEIYDCFLRFGRELDMGIVNKMLQQCEWGNRQAINFDNFFSLITTGKFIY